MTGVPNRQPSGPAYRFNLAIATPVARQLIGAFVLGVAGVALDPVPAHLVRLQRGVEPLPQLGILHRLLVGGAPAVALPAVDPAGDALAHILAVGVRSTTQGFFSASSAEIAAINSMRLLVVCGSPPFNSFSTSPNCRIAPQPPGPGLPEQAPSVKIVDMRRVAHATSPDGATP